MHSPTTQCIFYLSLLRPPTIRICLVVLSQLVLPNKQQKIAQNIRGVHNICLLKIFSGMFQVIISNGMVRACQGLPSCQPHKQRANRESPEMFFFFFFFFFLFWRGKAVDCSQEQRFSELWQGQNSKKANISQHVLLAALQSVPENVGCPSECPTRCPKSVAGVSNDRSVPDIPGALSGHFVDTSEPGGTPPWLWGEKIKVGEKLVKSRVSGNL